MEDIEILHENVQLKKQTQKFQDLNRIERKSFREYARLDNALLETTQVLIKKFDEVNFSHPEYKYTTYEKSGTFIVQVSDCHFNELIDLPYNKYDFTVASQRLQRYANDIKLQARIYNPNKIVVAFSGDGLNSNRRIDEALAQATNRTKATLIAVNLLEYFINDLLTIAPIDIIAVSGNESRVGEEWSNLDIIASDNYDYMIYNMLKLVFKTQKDVKFIDSDPVEAVFSVNGINILLLHGVSIKSDAQSSIQALIGKYAAKGVMLNYVIFGHIHFANITDLYARSGSLCGGNTYSDFGLNLVTKASQNLHIIENDKTIKTVRCELHNTENFPGYPVQNDIFAYNAKSADKLRSHKTILEIVI